MKVTLELFNKKVEMEMEEHFVIQHPEEGDRFQVIGAELFKGIVFAIIYIEGKGCFDLPFYLIPNGYEGKNLIIKEVILIDREDGPPRRRYKVDFAE